MATGDQRQPEGTEQQVPLVFSRKKDLSATDSDT